MNTHKEKVREFSSGGSQWRTVHSGTALAADDFEAVIHAPAMVGLGEGEDACDMAVRVNAIQPEGWPRPVLHMAAGCYSNLTTQRAQRCSAIRGTLQARGGGVREPPACLRVRPWAGFTHRLRMLVHHLGIGSMMLPKGSDPGVG